MNSGILIFMAFSSVLVYITYGYPTGVHDAACADMMPLHGGKPQRGDSPFSIQLSEKSLTNIDSLQLTLSTSEKQFRGFLVRVFPVGSSTPFTDGEFYNFNADAKIVCSDGVTHTNSDPKKSVVISWKPTASFVGNVSFVATVVLEYSTFWTNITSKPLYVNYSATDTTTSTNSNKRPKKRSAQDTQSNPNTNTQVPSQPTCDHGKRCFKAKCQNSECESVVMWKHDGVNMNFEIVSKYNPGRARWYAIGFSNDHKMIGTSIVMCKYQSDSMSVEVGYARVNYYEPLKDQGSISNTYLATSVKVMICKFQRLINATDEHVFNLHEKYYLMMATGPIIGEQPKQHEESPLISPSKIDFMKETEPIVGERGDMDSENHSVVIWKVRSHSEKSIVTKLGMLLED